MKKHLILLSIITFAFPYNGSITGVTYFDYTRENGTSAFNFNRQYFNYGIEMSNAVKFKVVFDVGRTNKLTDDSGNTEDTRLIVFLKKAQLDYKFKWGKVSLGLIGTNTYAVQEKNWGYRFIEKSAMDKNKFISTTDLGFGFSRRILDNLNLGIQLLNGEGYKHPQSNHYNKLNINVTYGKKNLLKKEGYNLGLAFASENTTTVVSVFGGFSLNDFRVGLESDFLSENNIIQNLTSFSSAYRISNKIDAFSRYDVLKLDVEQDHFYLISEFYFVSGIVYDNRSGLLVSPNISTASIDIDDIVYKLNFQFTF